MSLMITKKTSLDKHVYTNMQGPVIHQFQSNKNIDSLCL